MKRLSVLLLAVSLVLAVPVVAPAGGAGLDRALRAQDRHTDRLMSRGAVVGTAVGRTASGRPSVVILTKRAGVRLPASLDGVPVEVEVTGAIRAAHHRPGHGGGSGGGGNADLSPTARHPRPVPIGISTGNRGECSAGTIGARVKSGSNVYALSNNHVYALENDAAIGSQVLQPGLYDTGCAFSSDNVIGTLADFEPIVFDGTTPNTVDAAIASTTTSMLGASTPSGGYGTPSSSTVAPTVGTSVRKYGRTTGLTSGVVTGINATVRVGYDSGTALFVDQIIVESSKPFLKAGDSGSLAVTSSGNHPVGLLFAGNTSGKLGVANEIGLVLSSFGVTVDGS